MSRPSRSSRRQQLRNNDIYYLTQHASGADRPTASWSMMSVMARRQQGLAMGHGPSSEIVNRFRPNTVTGTLGTDMQLNRVQFFEDGNRLLAAGVGSVVKLYDTSSSRYVELPDKVLQAGHEVHDIDVSPDGAWFAYDSGNGFFLASMRDETVRKIITSSDIHMRYTCCGRRILYTTFDEDLQEYDVETGQQLNIKVSGYGVATAVGFVDRCSNVVYVGFSDNTIQICDRRCRKNVGALIGHQDSINYVNARMDDRYLLSCSLDSTIKLWDLRNMSPPDARPAPPMLALFGPPPPSCQDNSIMTYGGRVFGCPYVTKFSPAGTTGQRYICSGNVTGVVYMYDLLTGKIVESIQPHKDRAGVLDLDWHPHRPEIALCKYDWFKMIHRTVNIITHKAAIE